METRKPDPLERIADVIERQSETLDRLTTQVPEKVVAFGSPEFEARLRAEGYYDALEVPCFQNGRDIEPRGLPERTRWRLARLAAGTYVQKKISVNVDGRGQRWLSYPSATPEQRMIFSMTIAKDLPELIDKIWAEMVAAGTAPDSVRVVGAKSVTEGRPEPVTPTPIAAL